MLDEKKLEEIRRKVPQWLREGEISKREENKRFTPFYLNNALLSLNAARVLLEVSQNSELKHNFTFIDDSFEAYLWVVNPAYYSMFYMANALLSSEGIKINSELGKHKKTFETVVYYFYLTNRLPKYFLELFEEAQEESLELMGKDEVLAAMKSKTLELMKGYDSEMGKRSAFTYEIEEQVKLSKAETSIKRAIEFYQELRKVLER